MCIWKEWKEMSYGKGRVNQTRLTAHSRCKQTQAQPQFEWQSCRYLSPELKLRQSKCGKMGAQS